jgi:hypothetical protein
VRRVKYHVTKYSDPADLEAKLNSFEHPESGDVMQVFVNTLNTGHSVYTLIWKTWEETEDEP